jgi:hypothetical protein
MCPGHVAGADAPERLSRPSDFHHPARFIGGGRRSAAESMAVGFDADPGFDIDPWPLNDPTEPVPVPHFDFGQSHGA